MSKFKTATITLGSTVLVALPFAAGAAVSLGDSLGTTVDEISANLTADGYTVQEVEIEGDEIEVEAILDGVGFEFTVASATGAVTEIELDDDGANDDDDDDDDDDNDGN